ncbi:hypothetical protein A0H81_04625 [Grifola frondosa]|uniref:Major facilitator superfamily (MFS) profile domain-containing protein n=1 Tax=Grifola frondosa TaxID=5627 RepID=A0A1C7ME83_GRIFR|nr:hypothetical protein A0H81_04625 [Grifola frondosa]
MAVHHPQAFTTYGWIVCTWILIVSFQYGFHISSLNQIQAVLTCRNSALPGTPSTHYSLPTCIPMVWNHGRVCLFDALVIGRTLTGVAAGIGLCVGPIFLSEISPSDIKGTVGVLTQFAIVMGIMVTQAMGLQLATPLHWRLVLLFSSALSIAQLFAGPLVTESPVWLNRHGLLQDKDATARRLWKSGQIMRSPGAPNYDTEDPLLGDNNEEVHDSRDAEQHEAAVTVLNFWWLQLSGINAVLYYSNEILSKSLPDFGPYVSLGITVVNVLMTAAPIFLIDRLGRKSLLSLSAGGSLLEPHHIDIRCIVCDRIGPVPFVMIPEVSPHHAVSALSSVGLSVNWISNFLVGLVFLPSATS